MSLSRLRSRFLLLAITSLGSWIRAQPIVIDLTSADGTLTQTISGSNVTAVFDAIVAREDELAGFAGTAFTANVDYLGVPAAIQLDVSADGKSATLVIPSIGLKQTFDGTTTDDLQHKVESYVRTDGSPRLAEFRQEVNKRSSAGITDGNPNATTALLADSIFQALTLQRTDPPGADGPRMRMTLRGRAGEWRAERLTGRVVASDLELVWRAAPRWTVTGLIPLNYTESGGANTYGGGFATALTWRALTRDEHQPWSARASAFGGAMLRASEDLAAGGGVWTWGANFAVDRRVLSRGTVGLAAQFADFHGIPVTYEGFQLDRAVRQQMVKAGVQASWQLPGFDHRLEGSVTESHFLRAAALRSYLSAGVGYAWTWFAGSTWRVGYEADRGHHYRADILRGRVSLRF